MWHRPNLGSCVGFIRFNLFETTDAIQCTLEVLSHLTLRWHVWQRPCSYSSVRSIEVRRGFFRGWGRSIGVDGCGDGGRFRNHGRRTKWRRHHAQVVHDDFNGAILVGPLPLVMSEDEDDESVPVGGDNVVRKDVSILAELGDKGWRRAIVRVGANVEDRVRRLQHIRAYIALCKWHECLK